MIREILQKQNNFQLCNQSEKVLLDFNFDSEKENELLFFFKPECFSLPGLDCSFRVFDLVLDKFSKYDVDISGIMLISGGRLAEKKVMDFHYGYINKLSREASKLLTTKDKETIKAHLNIGNMSDYTIYGGHEFLACFGNYDEKTLNEFWLSKTSIKIRSGFYIQKYIVNNENIILINGFHPYQLKHYTDISQRLLILLIHSNMDWEKLKYDLVGDTFPEKAKRNSIRNDLLIKADCYGIQDISVACNYVHISAGPFEAFFEIDNFFKNLEVPNYRKDRTCIYKKLKQYNLEEKNIDTVLSNPLINVNNKLIDLFTYTESKNANISVNEYLDAICVQ